MCLTWSKTQKTGFLVTRLNYHSVSRYFGSRHFITTAKLRLHIVAVVTAKRFHYTGNPSDHRYRNYPSKQPTILKYYPLIGPRQANLVLIAYASSEGSVSPEPSLLAHTSSESRGTFRQKARSLAPLNGWACAVKICHDGMLEDTNSLDGAQLYAEIPLIFRNGN